MKLPVKIVDVVKIYSNEEILDDIEIFKSTGKYNIICDWHAPTKKNNIGILKYDRYVLALVKEENKILVELLYSNLEPKEAVDFQSANILLKENIVNFNINNIINKIKKHRKIMMN